MINKEYPESELTGKIIGCAMEVHRVLGNGFQYVFIIWDRMPKWGGMFPPPIKSDRISIKFD
jgi:hypothetical protein